MLIKPEVEKFAKIKVIGVGGGGSNTIKTMMTEQTIEGVDFVAVNTDAQHLASSPAPIKIQIGRELTKGLGAGGNPEVGRKSAEESADLIHQHLEGADMVFITAGIGGGTGTGASPFIAEVSKKQGALTIGVVTKPFSFEGAKRAMNADEGIAQLKEKVDALITIPNDRLLEIMDETKPLLDAFKFADSVLGQSVQGISDIIVQPGLINRDFADVKSIMEDAGSALMGIGYGSGETRAVIAAQNAIESPLLESTIEGAKGILFNVVGSADLSLHEVNKAAEVINAAADADANVIFGAAINPDQEDLVKITVIATGFDGKPKRKRTVSTSIGPDTNQTEPKKDNVEEIEDQDLETPAFMRRR
jgi:cell division protein FtsZ